ncbi:hypothetical protein OG618_36335 [Kitasatospora sp. NBC_01246]|uniref:hypothetical protein n=1 Tax=Kitasatospora sp. NBC_01246 TaxID=2903570 RepID=UPI002E370BF1|nr:hypothetical protein [Kitasatospora sp. NBC_01246]
MDGAEIVVLTPQQHAGLESARRQLGGQRAQVSRMKLDLRRIRELLSTPLPQPLSPTTRWPLNRIDHEVALEY